MSDAKNSAANSVLDGEIIVSLHAGYDTNGVYTDAFLARPADAKGPRPGVVLLSGMHGMTFTQREITRRYARAGFVALSPDYLGGQAPDAHDAALHAKNSLDVGPTVAALAGGAAFLRSLPWVGAESKVGIMGFCLGGGLALLACARTKAFDAGVIYHHSLFPDPRELAGIACPLQGHYGTDDHSTPREEVGLHAIGELVDRVGQRLLRQVRRAGGDVHDPEARLDLDDVGQLRVPAAHVDRGVDPGLRELRHELAHVHVHAARIALTGLKER